MLGGTVSATATAMGISYQAVDKWPDDLPPRIAERVIGVWAIREAPDVVAKAIPDLPAPEMAHEEGMRDFAEDVALCRKA